MLFNKSNTGIKELREYLGFLYASSTFENIKPDITLAEEDLIKVIGREVYTLASDHYKSDSFNSANEQDAQKKLLNELVFKFQCPVAYYAYYNFAPHADITHSDKGRQILVSETEKAAFEWQTVRDSAAVLNKAHKTTDRLIEFLDSQTELISPNITNSIYAAWRGSDGFKLSRELFISNASDFESWFPIDQSRRFYIKLLPFLREIERKYIKPVLKATRYDELKARILSDFKDITPEAKAKNLETISFVKPPMALYAMVMAIRRMPVEVIPDAIFRNYVAERPVSSSVSISTASVRREVGNNIEEEAKKELRALENHIAKLEAQEQNIPLDPDALTDRIVTTEKYIRL